MTETVSSMEAGDRSRGWVWTLIVGILSVVGGIFGLLNPFAASLTVAGMVGIFALLAGGVQFFAAFREETTRARIFSLIVGVLLAVFGLSLLAHPVAGLVTLTTFALAMFFSMGVLRILMAFKLRPESGWWTLALSGVVTIVLAIWLLSSLPLTALSLLGVLLAVDLLVAGGSLIMLALGRRM